MRYAEVVETFLDQAAPHLPQQSQWDLRPEDRRDLRAKFWGIAVPVVPTEAGALLNLALEDIKLARAGYPRELELPDRNPFTPAQAVRGIMANRLVEIGMHGGNQTRRISAPYGPSLALHELEECVEHDLREWASTKSPRVVAQDGDSELEEIVLAWLPAEDAIGTYLRLAEGELTLFSGLIWLQNDEAGYSYFQAGEDDEEDDEEDDADDYDEDGDDDGNTLDAVDLMTANLREYLMRSGMKVHRRLVAEQREAQRTAAARPTRPSSLSR